MGTHGWPFANASAFPDADVDRIPSGAGHVKGHYLRTSLRYEERLIGTILWDKKTSVIVDNEDSEIVQIFGSVCDD